MSTLARRTNLLTLVVATCGALMMLTATPALAVVAPEEPVTEAATAVTGTTATLHGELNPNASGTAGHQFVYGSSGTCEGVTTEPGAEVTGSKVEVATPITGLEGSTQYTFCVIATHTEAEETATTEGLPLRFRTSAAKPAPESESASGVTLSEATLEAVVNPENQQSTSCLFEYGETTGYGQSAACEQGVIEGSGAVGVSAHVTGLGAATTYHYRVVVENATGKAELAGGEFTTASELAPAIESESASALQSTATLSAVIDPEFQATTCTAFQYVTREAFEAGGYASAPQVPCAPEEVGVGGTGETTGASVAELRPNTTYHYRALAKNATGATKGPDETFLTLPEPPTVETGAASALTTTSAQITGTVDPQASGEGVQDDTVYYFQYGPGSSYGSQTPLTPGDVGEGNVPVTETANLTGLQPDETYHYRVVASNDNNATPQVAYGEDRTFTTNATPPLLSGVAVTDIATNSATIIAALDPQGLATHWELEVGQSPGALQLEGSGNTVTATQLAVALTSLSPGSEYYYRLSATSLNGALPPVEGTFATDAAAQGPSGPIAQPVTPALLQVPDIAFPMEEKGTTGTTTTTKKLTRAQKLAKALKVCKKEKKSKRARCEKQARKKYPVAEARELGEK